MKKNLLTCVAMLFTTLLLTQAVFISYAQDAQTPEAICAEAPTDEPATREYTEPEQVLEDDVDYRAILCTGAGPVYIDLLEDYAPLAVNSFVFLAEQGYYNNTTFHRVLQNFMAQGGDPTATGSGGPGYEFDNEAVGFLNFDVPGWLAMANAGVNTNGSQFFITTVPYPSLDYSYTIFGEVLEGQENVNNIRLRDPDSATEPGEALNTVVIIDDPAMVQTTYEAPVPATSEEIGAMMEEINGQIPPQLALDTELTGVFTTAEAAEAAEAAPEALRSDFAAFLENHHHEFRVSHHLSNAACDLQAVPYLGIGYTLDRFASPEDATAALEDGLLGEIAIANGYTETTIEGLNYPVYARSSNACNTAATDAITFWQRGHFVVTAQALFPADSPASADRWLRDLVGISYESIFSDPLRRELR
jgi:cyclophilin family peptidyl-prolyl cis-trans isomerase